MNINKVKLNANLSKNYSTHMATLIKAVMRSTGDVVEVGSGPFSTPLLHWLCKDLKKKLITYENDQTYFNFAAGFRSPLHSIRFVKGWDEMDVKTHRGVVFIDHHPPERRSIDTLRFKDSADLIVIHDTERINDEYNMASTFPQFRYVYTWKDCRPWTSVVSNFVNPNQWI